MFIIVNPWKRDKSDPAEIVEQHGNKGRAFQKQAMGHFRSLTPEAVQGRTHTDVQTGKHVYGQPHKICFKFTKSQQ